MFGFLTATAICGAISHSFPPSDWLSIVFWQATIVCLPFIAAALSMALISHVGCNSPLWHALVSLKLGVFLYLGVTRLTFLYAILDYVPVVIIYSCVAFSRSLVTLSCGLLLTLLAAAIQQLNISPSEWFDNNALYHVVQMIALYFIFKALKPYSKNH